MAINIIQGYNPSTTEPIDSRQLVADKATRFAILAFNAYNGMIVYQQDTKALWILTDIAEIGNDNGWSVVGGGSGVPQFDGLITADKDTCSLITLYDPEDWDPIITGTAGQYQIDFKSNVLLEDKTHVQISAGINPSLTQEIIVTWAFDYAGNPRRVINIYAYKVGTGFADDLLINASITVKVYT
jgi:hypothetical protein